MIRESQNDEQKYTSRGYEDLLTNTKVIRENFQNQSQLKIDNLIEIEQVLDEDFIDSSGEIDDDHVSKKAPELQLPKKVNRQGFSNDVWQRKSLLIIYQVTKFIIILLQNSEKFKFSFVNRNIIEKINDPTSDYDYYTQGGFIRQKLNPNLALKIKNYLQKSGVFRSVRHIFRELLKKFVVFTPTTTEKVLWDGIVYIILLLNIVYIPLKVSFDLTKVENQSSYYYLDLVPTIFYLVDISIIFNTGFYSHGVLVLDRSLIARNYFRTYFIQDLISILPLILRFNTSYLELIQLVRINRILVITKSLEQRFNLRTNFAAIIDVTKLVFLFLFVCHLIACTWHLVAQFETNGINWILNANLQNSPWQSRYVASLYWSFVTTLTIGYGDIIPTNDAERIFVICVGLISSVTFGYTVSSIGTIFTQMNELTKLNKDKISSINFFMQKRGIDKELQVKIQKFFEYYFFKISQVKDQQSEELFKDLTSNLQKELKINMYKKMLSKSNMLQRFSQEFIESLCFIMHEKSVVPEENILVQGQIVNQLNFVMKGHVDIFVHKGMNSINQIKPTTTTSLRSLGDGQSIEELQFLTHDQSRFNAKASSFTRLAYITFVEFEQLLNQSSEDLQKYQEIKNQIIMKEPSVFVGCEICYKRHDYLKCPFIFYCPSISKLIKKQMGSIQPRTSLDRPQRTKTRNTIQNARYNQECAIIYQVQSNIINEVEVNDEYMKKYGHYGRQTSDFSIKKMSLASILSKNDENHLFHQTIHYSENKELESVSKKRRVLSDIKLRGSKLLPPQRQMETISVLSGRINSVTDQDLSSQSFLQYNDEKVHQISSPGMITNDMKRILQNDYLNLYSQHCILDIDEQKGFINYYPQNNFNNVVQKIQNQSSSTIFKSQKFGKFLTPMFQNKRKKVRKSIVIQNDSQIKDPTFGKTLI